MLFLHVFFFISPFFTFSHLRYFFVLYLYLFKIIIFTFKVDYDRSLVEMSHSFPVKFTSNLKKPLLTNLVLYVLISFALSGSTIGLTL